MQNETKDHIALKEMLKAAHQKDNDRLYLGVAPKSQHMVIVAMKLKDTYSLEEKL